MNRPSIHMVKAAYKHQFTVAMLHYGLSPEKYYREVGLPVSEQLDADALLPEKPFWHLVNLIANRENVPSFGSTVAQLTPWHKVETLGSLLLSSDTLGELLQTFCNNTKSQSTQANFSVTTENQHCFFNSLAAPLLLNDTQMELYRATAMILLIQLVTGKNWYPEHMHLRMHKTPIINQCSLIRNSTIEYNQGHTLIQFDASLLKAPLNHEHRKKEFNPRYITRGESFREQIKLISRPFINHNNFSIEDIAKATDSSIRSIQRQLKNEGASFKAIIDEIKNEMAQDKLQNSLDTVAEIADSLGYSDAAHFSRAFKRWNGLSPKEFRKNNTLTQNV